MHHHHHRGIAVLALLGLSLNGCGTEPGGSPLPVPTQPSCVEACASVAAAGHEPRMLAITGERIYWSTRTGGVGTVQSAPVAGGPAQVIASFEADSTPRLALDATHVYWIETREAGALRRATLEGDAVETLASGIKLLGSLAVSGERVYFTSFDRSCIATVPIDGGPISTLADLCPDGTHFLGALEGADAEQLYVSSGILNSTALWTVPIGGGDPQALASIEGEIRSFAATPQAIFVAVYSDPPFTWTDETESSVWRIPRSGGPPPTKIVTLGRANGIAADASGVYFTDEKNGQVLRASLDGTSIEAIVSDLDEPTWIALDEGHVYFSHWTAAGAEPTISRTDKAPSSME